MPLSHAGVDGWIRTGTVAGVSRRKIRVALPGLTIGACVEIERTGMPDVIAEVVDLEGTLATCAPIAGANGIVAGARARSTGARIGSFVGEALLGREPESERERAGASAG